MENRRAPADASALDASALDASTLDASTPAAASKVGKAIKPKPFLPKRKSRFASAAASVIVVAPESPAAKD